MKQLHEGSFTFMIKINKKYKGNVAYDNINTM